MGYPSLHVFAVKKLKYSSGAAHRRIKAMHFVREMPELKQELLCGEPSLSTTCSIQNFFQLEKKYKKHYSRDEKTKIISTLKGKSRREVDQFLTWFSPEKVPRN